MKKDIPPPILIAYLAHDMVHTSFNQSLATLVSYSVARGFHIGISRIQCTAIEIGRGVAAAKMLKEGCEHILCLDSDMVFPADTLQRLMNRSKDIVGCTYSQRISPRGLTHESLNGLHDLPTDPRESLFEVKSLGFGCILIRRKVFETMQRPWFRVQYDGTVLPDGSDGHRSEDRSFCDYARATGFKIWCDLPLSQEIKHCGVFQFGLEHVEMAQEMRMGTIVGEFDAASLS